MTPDQIAAAAATTTLIWIKAFTPVVLALVLAWLTIKNAVDAKIHKEQIDQNTARLNGQSTKIDTLLLNTTPLGHATVSASVSGPNGASATVTEGAPPVVPVPPVIVPVGIPNAAPLP